MQKLLQSNKICLKYKFTKSLSSKIVEQQKLSINLLSFQIVSLPNCRAFIGF